MALRVREGRERLERRQARGRKRECAMIILYVNRLSGCQSQTTLTPLVAI